jgi:isopentenyl diphosphate isomerase/L-lactate dehydrogenase-like FMN-dependent dehydrogenase
VPNFRFKLTSGPSLMSIEDYRRSARRNLPLMVWSYVEGGADDLVSLNDNLAAFRRWSFRPRALTGHAQHELKTAVAGVTLEIPILLAPTGATGLSHWRGDIAAARAAERAGTRYVVSTFSSWSMEEIAQATEEPHFFQLYPAGDEGIVSALMSRAWNAGYTVMFVTVDVPTLGNREGERRHGMGRPPVLTPFRVLDAARRLRWSYNLLRHSRISGANLVAGRGLSAAMRSVDLHERIMIKTLNWDDIAWMRERWSGRFFIKGILDPADAERAAALGVDGIVVSNHGGRQLDCAPATLDALPDIVAAVGDRLEVLLDGGVRRGSDVLKALCLGARAVLIGRPYIYGLAARGEQGVTDVLEILRGELDRTMTLMGVEGLSQLSPSWLVRRTETAPLEITNRTISALLPNALR